MIKTCFAHNDELGCAALEDFSGCGRDCPFYRSNTQAGADVKKAHRRLACLPEETQTHIAEKYYEGVRVWLPERKRREHNAVNE